MGILRASGAAWVVAGTDPGGDCSCTVGFGATCGWQETQDSRIEHKTAGVVKREIFIVPLCLHEA